MSDHSGGVGACLVTATTTALGYVEQAQAGLTSGLLTPATSWAARLAWRWSPPSARPASAAVPWPADPPVTGFDRAFLALAALAAVSAVATVWLLPAGRPPATDLPVVAH